MKRSLLFFSSIFIAGVVVLVFWWMRQEVVGKTNQISDRSQQKIDSKEVSGNSNRLQFSSLTAGELIQSDCFTFALPFDARNIKSDREDTECTVRFDSISPRGVVVIHSRENKTRVSLDEITSVQLRSATDSGYIEQFFEASDSAQRSFSNEHEITTIRDYQGNTITISFSEFGQISDEVLKAHDSLLKSLIIQETLLY